MCCFIYFRFLIFYSFFFYCFRWKIKSSSCYSILAGNRNNFHVFQTLSYFPCFYQSILYSYCTFQIYLLISIFSAVSKLIFPINFKFQWLYISVLGILYYSYSFYCFYYSPFVIHYKQTHVINIIKIFLSLLVCRALILLFVVSTKSLLWLFVPSCDVIFFLF